MHPLPRRAALLVSKHPLKVVLACLLGTALLYTHMMHGAAARWSSQPRLVKDGAGAPCYVLSLSADGQAREGAAGADWGLDLDLDLELDSELGFEGLVARIAETHPAALVLSRLGLSPPPSSNIAPVLSLPPQSKTDLGSLENNILIVSPSGSIDMDAVLSGAHPPGPVSRPRSTYGELLGMLSVGRWGEIALFAIGVVGMYSTLFLLFHNFRRIGSKFSLACCSLVMGSMDLLLALTAIERLGVAVEPLLLLECVPLFIMAIGFRKPYLLAKSIYSKRQKSGDVLGIVLGLQETGRSIATDYVKEVFLFSLFALSDVPGLREFSLLCVFILLADALLLFTFFLATIALRMRVHAARVHVHPAVQAESPWRGRAKFILTFLLLAMYSLNLLSLLSAKTITSSLTIRHLLPLLERILGKDARIYSLPPLSVGAPGARPFRLPGALGVASQVIARIIPSLAESSSTNLQTLLRVSLFLSLPISLVANYYLYRLIQAPYHRSKAATTAAAVTTSTAASKNSSTAPLVAEGPAKQRPPVQPGCSPPKAEDPDGGSSRDDDLAKLVDSGKIPLHALEQMLGDCERAVRLRRAFINRQLARLSGVDAPAQCQEGISPPLQSASASASCSPPTLNELPWEGYDFSKVLRTNCENVIGYVPVPVGVAGPIRIDGKTYYVPMATTEGALVASTNRGCKAVSRCGITSALLDDGMTRGPVLRLPSITEALRLKTWIEDNFAFVADVFNGTSKHLALTSVPPPPPLAHPDP